MNWFKHDSNASTDAKIKKLILKYGTDGYAIYFHCIELIVSDVSENNITFSLEHDSEIIADNLKIKGTQEQSGVDRVEEIMMYIVDSGLFEENNGHITCYKILKRLDSSMTSNQKMRKMITTAKESHDDVMISHDDVMQEEKRIEEIEENRRDNTIPAKLGTSVYPFGEIVEQYKTLCPLLPTPLKINDKRRSAIKSLSKTFTTEEIQEGFKLANQSDFLTGKSGEWKAGFDWVINKNNMTKILEGNYKNRPKKTNGKKTLQADQMTETVQGFKCN